jgi:hypothetical protein
VPYCDSEETKLEDTDAVLGSLFSLMRLTFLYWQLEDRKERRCSESLRRAIDRLHDPDLLRKEAMKSRSILSAGLLVTMVNYSYHMNLPATTVLDLGKTVYQPYQRCVQLAAHRADCCIEICGTGPIEMSRTQSPSAI